jgi:hypothetical protein
MQRDSKKTKKIQRAIAHVSDVLPTFWIRLPFQTDNGGNWIVLGSRRYFLWNFRIFLAVVYFIVQTLK